MFNFRIGTDPEVMIVNDRGEIVSAVGLLPGTKEEPFYFKEGFAVQTDNVMGEFCVPPTNDPFELHDSIRWVMDEAKKLLPKGYNFLKKSSHFYDPIELETPQAKTFGCDPDFNPYRSNALIWKEGSTPTLVPNPTPASSNKTLRTCGGHIHLDITNVLSNKPITDDGFWNINLLNSLAIGLDFVLGIRSLKFDPDNIRKQLYGKAGAFRPKPYGLEYRVLSNYWIDDINEIIAIYKNIDLLLLSIRDIDYVLFEPQPISGHHTLELSDTKLLSYVENCINTNNLGSLIDIPNNFIRKIIKYTTSKEQMPSFKPLKVTT